jgi:mono/diheme cytochrome c family protein
MLKVKTRSFRCGLLLSVGCLLPLLAWTTATIGKAEKARPASRAAEYTTEIRPLLKQYCFSCHSSKKKKGDLDLERFAALDQVRKDVAAWQAVVEMLENGAMPPPKSRQLNAEDRRQLLSWTRGLLAVEARSRAGDPGRVVVRRLSNAEYNNTIRDLTGVDIQPARDFPIDGAAGEGFTNAGDALATSSTLLNKYLGAAKEIAAHAVLLPDGFRFSPAKTRRDWTDEVRNELRAFYAQFSGDGKLPLRPYLNATIRHREDLAAGRVTLEAVARQDKINPKYLRILWQTLTDKTPSFPLDRIRARWRQAKPAEVDAVLADIASWQQSLWRFVKIGSYVNTHRQLPNVPADDKGKLAAAPGSAEAKRTLQGFDDFRRCFPAFICYSRVIPDDEVVCLKLFHREDDDLIRLFLNDEQTKRLDRLWRDLRFIARYPVTENNQLPQFIGFVTQDQPKSLVAFFEGKREPFRKRAEEFLKEEENAIPKQLDALLDFAIRAYRRPLRAEEKTELLRLHETLRKKGLSHEEAFRTVLTRVLISPSFLFRIEQAAPGKEAQPVSSWELATRLSYFLWATMPDAELRQAAAQGCLHDPKVLTAQVARMLKDPKVRGLAAEFGTQWLHVRDIQQNREKNEKLFPTFDDTLRTALYEESVLFFQDLFQEDRRLADILDADYTFLNETLARHYGIPGVVGPQWRRVTGVRKYGRGGVLALGSVLTKQSGASRTSPVLRGNWLVETMLGEKLPKPPPNVPRLPEEETGSEGTVRQMVEKHARIAECAVCHQRIDPFGFSLENFDPIGRFRDKDLGGRPIDTKVSLTDGTTFEGIDGLRQYLLKQRGEEFERYFCRKLLGYALGRSVILSDQPLIEEMIAELKKNDYRLSVAVQTIARSKQFRYHRGLEATKDE